MPMNPAHRTNRPASRPRQRAIDPTLAAANPPAATTTPPSTTPPTPEPKPTALPAVYQCQDPTSIYYGAVAVASENPNWAFGVFHPLTGAAWFKSARTVQKWTLMTEG